MHDDQYPRFSHKLDALAEELTQRVVMRKTRSDDFRQKIQDFRIRYKRVTSNRLVRLRLDGIFIRRSFIFEEIPDTITEKEIETDSEIISEVEVKPLDLIEPAEQRSKTDEELILEREISRLSLPNIFNSKENSIISLDLGKLTPYGEDDRRTPYSGNSTPRLSRQNTVSTFRRLGRKMQTVRRLQLSKENTLTVLDEQSQLQINTEGTKSSLKQSKTVLSPEIKTKPASSAGRRWTFAVSRGRLPGRSEPTEQCGNCSNRHRSNKQKFKTASTAIYCVHGFQNRPL